MKSKPRGKWHRKSMNQVCERPTKPVWYELCRQPARCAANVGIQGNQGEVNGHVLVCGNVCRINVANTVVEPRMSNQAASSLNRRNVQVRPYGTAIRPTKRNSVNQRRQKPGPVKLVWNVPPKPNAGRQTWNVKMRNCRWEINGKKGSPPEVLPNGELGISYHSLRVCGRL